MIVYKEIFLIYKPFAFQNILNLQKYPLTLLCSPCLIRAQLYWGNWNSLEVLPIFGSLFHISENDRNRIYNCEVAFVITYCSKIITEHHYLHQRCQRRKHVISILLLANMGSDVSSCWKQKWLRKYLILFHCCNSLLLIRLCGSYITLNADLWLIYFHHTWCVNSLSGYSLYY